MVTRTAIHVRLKNVAAEVTRRILSSKLPRTIRLLTRAATRDRLFKPALSLSIAVLLMVCSLGAGCVHYSTIAARNESFSPYHNQKVGSVSLGEFMVTRAGVVFQADELRLAGPGTDSTRFSLTGRNKSYGTAAAIDGRGYFLTAAHCVNKEPVWLVFLRGGQVQAQPARVVWRGKVSKGEPDLAVLQVPVSLREVFELANEPREGDPIVGVGLSSADRTNLVTQCMAGQIVTVQARTNAWPSYQILSHTMPLRHGDSGGPIVTPTGQLLGVNVSGQLTLRWSRASFEPTSWEAERPDPTWLRQLIAQDVVALKAGAAAEASHRPGGPN